MFLTTKRLFKRTALFIFLVCGSNALSHAENEIWEWMPPKESLMELYANGRIAAKLQSQLKYSQEEYIRQLEKGNSKAQFYTALMLYQPLENPQYIRASFRILIRAMDDAYPGSMKALSFYKPFVQNPENVIDLLQDEIRQGNQMAVFVLANITQSSENPAYQKLSIEMYKKASWHGIAMAQHNMARKYMDGIQVKKNTAQALSLFRRAAYQGATRSVRSLIHHLSKDTSNLKNLKEAYFWCIFMEKHGPQPHSTLKEQMDHLVKYLSNEDILEAEEKLRKYQFSLEWLPRSQR